MINPVMFVAGGLPEIQDWEFCVSETRAGKQEQSWSKCCGCKIECGLHCGYKKVARNRFKNLRKGDLSFLQIAG